MPGGEATTASDIGLWIDKEQMKLGLPLLGMQAKLEEVLHKEVDLLATETLDQAFLHGFPMRR